LKVIDYFALEVWLYTFLLESLREKVAIKTLVNLIPGFNVVKVLGAELGG
jgi:hypothetical protein